MNKRLKQKTIFFCTAGAGVLLILIIFGMILRSERFVKYEDLLQGFSIQYPEDWAAIKESMETAVIFRSPLVNDLDVFQENVNVVVQSLDPENPQDLSEYTQKAIKQMEVVFEEKLTVLESKPTFLAGRPAHRFFYRLEIPQGDFRILHIWTVAGLRAYQVTYTASSQQFDNFIQKVNKMVRSFKLI